MELSEVQREENAKKALKIGSIVVTGVVAYFFTYAGYYATNNDVSFFSSLLLVFLHFGEQGLFFIPSFKSFQYALFAPVIGALSYFFLSIDYRKNQSAKRGTEAGTARFMSEKERSEYNKQYIEPDPPVLIPTKEKPVFEYDPKNDPKMYPQNFIMSANFCRPCNLRKYRLLGNNNILIVGGAGTGKSRFLMKPNILQMNSSYVITDPSGEMIESTGSVLKSHGYKIRIFNISDMGHSNCYNPLNYIRDEAGVDMLIECLINNTTKGEGGGDNQFFVDAEKLLYSACIFYLKDFCNDVSKRNFANIMKMINASRVDENNPNAKSKLDEMFDAIPQDSLAASRYRAFKQAAGKTLKSIIISCVVRLRPFMTPQVINLTSTDNLDLGNIGYEKTALFIITPQADRTYAFLASMLYSQLFETLYHKGEEQKAAGKSEELPIPVRCLMDEFANIGEVPEFPSKLATMRKYNISATIVLQDIAQIEAMYQDNYKTLVGNCSTYIFLGTQEPNTLKYYSELMGEQTIRVKSENRSEGTKGSTSKGFQATGRALMTADELGCMPSDECIVFTQNRRPVRDKKYMYENHPYYKQTGDYDKRYSFLYKQMQIYDNTRRSKLTNLLQALSEGERIRSTSQKNTSDKGNLRETAPISLRSDRNYVVCFDDEREKRIYQSCFSKCLIYGADNIRNGVCIVNIEDIPIQYMNRLCCEVAAHLSVSRILLLTNDANDVTRCVAYGRSKIDQNILAKSMKNEYAEKILQNENEPYIVTAVPSRLVDKYMNSVINAINNE